MKITNFRHYYFTPEELVSALNERIRIRLGNYIGDLIARTGLGYKAAAEIAYDIGVKVKNFGVNRYDFEDFFNRANNIDLLGALTPIYRVLNKELGCSVTSQLNLFINDCFRQEGASYEINERGEVRYMPDAEFERNRILTLKNLSRPELKAVVTVFNKAYDEFNTDISKSKNALRDIFEANEILFKKIVSPQYKVDQLNAANIAKCKDYILNKMLLSDQAARVAANKLFESYKDWVDGIHPYRHGQDTDTYTAPSKDFTILALSMGASFLRWLASIYNSYEPQS